MTPWLSVLDDMVYISSEGQGGVDASAAYYGLQENAR